MLSVKFILHDGRYERPAHGETIVYFWQAGEPGVVGVYDGHNGTVITAVSELEWDKNSTWCRIPVATKEITFDE